MHLDNKKNKILWKPLSLLFMALLVIVNHTQNVFSITETVEVDRTVFTVGKTYKAKYSAFVPVGNANGEAKDEKGKPIDVSQPSCFTPNGFPYGTKFRIFNTTTKKDGTLCVSLNKSSSSIGTDGSIPIDLVVPSDAEMNAWDGIKDGLVIIVSVGDGKSLDFGDEGLYKSPGEVEVVPGAFDNNDSELEEEFFIQNDIYYYNPKEENCDPANGVGTGLDPNATKEQRAEYILRYLTGVGFTLNQAAGFVGNFVGESGLNPACIESKASANTLGCCGGNTLDPSTGQYTCGPERIPFNSGFGLAQWTSGRQALPKALAEKRGKHLFDMDLQLEALMMDMVINRGNRLFVSPHLYANKVANKRLHEANTATEAAFQILDNFENPGKANTCGYGAFRRGESNCKSSPGPVTEAVAEATYKHYLNSRAKEAEKYAEMFRGKISDGEGVTYESLRERFGAGVEGVGGPDDQSEHVDLCRDSGFSGSSLQEMVFKAAWPLFCSQGTTMIREEGDLRCNNMVPTDFYKELIACRKGSGGICKYPGGYVGGSQGQDCGGFVTTMMQESGFDEGYLNNKWGYTGDQEKYVINSPKWRLIFSRRSSAFDSSQLQPGDVAFCNEDGGCGHTFLYIGDLPGFEYPAASASYASGNHARGRFPMAGQEILKGNDYNWYRKIDGGDSSASYETGGAGRNVDGSVDLLY